MKATDYKVCVRVLNQTARVAKCVHVYECVIFVHVTHVRLALNLSLVCTITINTID